MTSDENNQYRNYRSSTDNSLKAERTRTDAHIAGQTEALEKKSDETNNQSRNAADLKRDRARLSIDVGEAQRESNVATKENAGILKELKDERERSDLAQRLERNKVDFLRDQERLDKRLLAESLLSDKRTETNARLSDERSHADRSFTDSAKLLKGEQSSHEKTRDALTTRDQFLAIVSHDLRNPLGSIMMSANAMADDLIESPKTLNSEGLLETIEIIQRNASTMQRLIADLLDVERIANNIMPMEFERNDVCDLLKECHTLLAPVLGKRIFEVDVEGCGEPVFAEIDRDRILQVLSNLIGNAVKFTKEGGKIVLAARKRENVVEISVIDNGSGIPKEQQNRIFERFSQIGLRDRRGLGLGLFISKWIVEAHTGSIAVTSTGAHGSTFTVVLPVIVSH